MTIIRIISLFLPWQLKRLLLQRLLGYELHPSANIGIAWIFPRHLVMGEGSRIDHFNVAIHLDRIEMGSQSIIGRRNWITGFPTRKGSRHFSHQPERVSELILGDHSAITKNHHLDCTSPIKVGSHTTIAGYHSQFLTHSIDLSECRQDSQPIHIGNYCFVGTNVVILGGSALPSRSVLGAKSLLRTAFRDETLLYAGVPAVAVKALPEDLPYFNRTEGFIH
jgi:acetyltransferase-like isoleucine patch superfamily enzyme